ncbi:MAG TPA: hypothetical protein PKD87_11865 [Burkholderiaceae bacterium]|nr:hypothetical protein [Burkholderiaceae bacterium]
MNTHHYIPGHVPADAPDWIARELRAISEATFGAAPDVQLIPRAVEPQRPRTGMVVFADGADWDPGSGAGVYVYTGSAWSKL